MAVRGADADDALVRICDLAGRPRGTGFIADTDGTLLTSHEAVDGLARLVLHAHGEQTCLVGPDAITPYPEEGLAVVATEGLTVPALPIACHGPSDPEGRVRLPGPTRADAAVTGVVAATYTATDRYHLLEEAYALTTGAPEAPPSGTPLIDAHTGAVLGVVATALHASRSAAAFAVPLRTDGPLAELVARNAATVPAYGPHLNLAGALQLTATSVGSAAAGLPREWREPVRRPGVEAELRRFLEAADDGPLVLGLVGDPGCGRTTELGALAARRARGSRPAPTVWLRGAELRPGDGGLKEAVERSLRAAGRIVDASRSAQGRAAPPLRTEVGDGRAGEVGEAAEATPDAVAHLARAAGRPLLVLLDAPEEMPPVLAHALPDWTSGTTSWLRAAGVRLVVACRPEHWEQAGALFPPGLLYRPHWSGPTAPPGAPARALPDCVRLGDLRPRQAERARQLYGIEAGRIAPADAAHPLTLRLLSEVRAAAPDVEGAPTREAVFSAHLDLVCLRMAVRLGESAGESYGPHDVRRMAARVAGQVHEAARRCLGPGQGELDREAFEEIFPWRTGWASAVLTEGLLVPAGAGYRFAHEEFADWLQGSHIDLEAALHALVHRWFASVTSRREAVVRLPSHPVTTVRPGTCDGGAPPPPPAPSVAPTDAPHVLPVPRHRIGPVVQSLLLAGRRDGPDHLARRLDALVDALDTAAAVGAGDAARCKDAVWWAAHLLGEVLLRVPDAEPYRGVLRRLAGRITARAGRHGGFTTALDGLGEFGPWFWRRLPLPVAGRLELIRLMLPADGRRGTVDDTAEGMADGGSFLAAAGQLLCADAEAALPVICRWFDDDRPVPGTGRTVAAAVHILLHTHRHHDIDALTEALVDTAHPRADRLLAALAKDEPSAVCRAVDRWAHDDRPERRVAAATYGLRAAAHVCSEPDRELLRYAALALLGRASDCSLHGAALALLVRDPVTRNRHLGAALARFVSGDRYVPASAIGVALPTHPEPVFAAFQARLREPGGVADAEILAELAAQTTPALARRAAACVRSYADHRPEGARHVADYLERRLEQGPAGRAVVFPLAVGLLREGRPEMRRAIAPVLAAPGGAVSRPLRQELLDVLLERERDPAVLEALLQQAAEGCLGRPAVQTRELVHRVGLLLGRTAEGAAYFDRRLVQLASASPSFAAHVRDWLACTEWDAVVGPSARHMCERLPLPS
ncbi:serine protease [Streptomyces sp. RB6PN25]|uniref:Serine protease n=1 Tax=Streptomyces humicola TaxID=2953240 RepID=A0ABT1Q3Q4_9ACTN|nr:serine protease [Streptomyces humicola]MCQ4084544.1 serine protease [Streptomyces humicola]